MRCPPINVDNLRDGTVLQHHPIAALEGALDADGNPCDDICERLPQREGEDRGKTASDHRQLWEIIRGQVNEQACKETAPISAVLYRRWRSL
ncbi:hypothetical protein [Tropicimonas aquimaris]|uniref:Uncharacterized protein n=1 Tax=Tropicimonas aquimaris TaxID=914152 RepID=A0ABW3IS85_9RHOB